MAPRLRSGGDLPKWVPFLPLVPATALGLLLAFNLILHLCVAIPFPYEAKGWSEGHLLHNAIQLSRGESIYVDPVKEVPTAFAYGFVYPAMMAPLVMLCGPALWIGRALSTAAAAATLALLFFAAKRRAEHGLAGVLAVSFALVTYKPALRSWDWTHPDSLFICLGVGAILAIDGGRAERRGWAVLAALLAVSSVLTKQTGAGFLVGLSVFLLIRKNGRAVTFIGAAGIFAVAAVACAQLLTGGWYLRYTVGLMASHSYNLNKLVDLLGFRILPRLGRPMIAVIPLLLLAGIWEVAANLRSSPRRDPLPWALLAVSIPALAALAKTRGAHNNLSPILLLLAVPASVRICRLFRAWKPRPVLTTLLSSALLIQALLAPKTFAMDPPRTKLRRRLGDLIQAEIRSTQGPVLVGHCISFAYLNGQEVHDSFAMMYEWHAAGHDISDRLVRQLDARYFKKMVFPTGTARWLTERVVLAINRNYRLDHVIGRDIRLPGFSPVQVRVPRGKAIMRRQSPVLPTFEARPSPQGPSGHDNSPPISSRPGPRIGGGP